MRCAGRGAEMSGAIGSSLPRGVRQLSLAFPLNSECLFSNFLDQGNEELLSRLQAMAVGQRLFSGCFLWGEAGVGKTHLLQAACQQQGEAGHGAIYLPLGDSDVVPQLLEGLEHLRFVALDDLDAWVGQREHEQALMGLYQGLLETGGQLLLSATRPHLEFCYADLASRIQSLAAYPVRPLDDAGKSRVLRRLAAERGLTLEASVLDFWFARGPRGLADLIGQLELLDRAAMEAQRRITVPLLKAVLGL